jgi:hypothetical protein
VSTAKIDVRSAKCAQIAAECMALAVLTPADRADVFVNFQAHVNGLSVVAYAGGWAHGKQPEFDMECTAWADETQRGWDVVVDALREFLMSLEPQGDAAEIAAGAVADVKNQREDLN